MIRGEMFDVIEYKTCLSINKSFIIISHTHLVHAQFDVTC